MIPIGDDSSVPFLLPTTEDLEFRFQWKLSHTEIVHTFESELLFSFKFDYQGCQGCSAAPPPLVRGYCNWCNFVLALIHWSYTIELSRRTSSAQRTPGWRRTRRDRWGNYKLRNYDNSTSDIVDMTLCAEQHKGCFRADQWQVCWAGREAALRHPSERSGKKTSEDSSLRKSKNLMKTPPTKKRLCLFKQSNNL